MERTRAQAFGSLRSRNVRLFLTGQFVSLVGTWVQQVAMGCVAYRRNGLPLHVGGTAPACQSFGADMVESRDDVGNAVALHASVTNAARLLGPSIGGAIVARAGEGVCFLVNGASYAAVLLALLAMREAPEVPARPATPILQGLRETARYARSTRPIGAILLLAALVTLLGRPYTVLLPVFAAEVL